MPELKNYETLQKSQEEMENDYIEMHGDDYDPMTLNILRIGCELSSIQLAIIQRLDALIAILSADVCTPKERKEDGSIKN